MGRHHQIRCRKAVIKFLGVAKLRPSYGRRGGRPPRRHYRTPRDGFPITGLFSHTSLCHGHPIVYDYSLTRLDTCTVGVGIYAHASPVCDSRSIEGCFFPAPVSSRVPSPRQHIPGITLGISFLGDPSRQGIRLGCLLPSLREPLTGYSVPCIHFP